MNIYKPFVNPVLVEVQPTILFYSTQSLLREVEEICRVILLAAATFWWRIHT
jgi:hypothetical protein